MRRQMHPHSTHSHSLQDIFSKGESCLYGDFEARVVEVHVDYDDEGNYKPFYTIAFERDSENVEKQTDRERLSRRG